MANLILKINIISISILFLHFLKTFVAIIKMTKLLLSLIFSCYFILVHYSVFVINKQNEKIEKEINLGNCERPRKFRDSIYGTAIILQTK